MIVRVEGVEVRARVVSLRRLVSVWKKLSGEPFPRVRAFLVEDGDFDCVVRLSKSGGDARREREEWGRVLSAEGTDAFVYSGPDEFVDVDYVIVIRENSYHSVEEILEHELAHIARGDL